MNKTELLAFLNEHGLKPKRSLSQNFLIDNNITKKILEIAEVKSGDNVLEIGPGPGMLTRALIDAGANVTAVETDRQLAALLPSDANVIQGDALKVDIPLTQPTKIVSNLPYHITTPILERFMPLFPTVTSITAMVQKEYAERLTAELGTRQCGYLTLLAKCYGDSRIGHIVKPTCFYPPPKVDSAIIRMDLHEPLGTEVLPIARKAFAQRRKMLRKTLGIDSTKRPEQLTLAEWLLLLP